MPKGQASNEYLNVAHFKYQTFNDALKMIKPGYYLSKVDLRHVYRTVPIHPSNHEATELKWQFKGNKLKYTFLIDPRLDALRHMFWLSPFFNFKLTVRHIPGLCNIIADAISCIHEFKYLMYFYHILKDYIPQFLA